MEKLVRGLIFLDLSDIALNQTQSAAVYTFTVEGALCLDPLVMHFSLICDHFIITVDALSPHRGQGPGTLFTFDQLLFLHLEPHNNWPHCWPYMLHQCISVIINVLIWHSGNFREKAILLHHSSSTPWRNCSAPYLIPCCSIWFNHRSTDLHVLLSDHQLSHPRSLKVFIVTDCMKWRKPVSSKLFPSECQSVMISAVLQGKATVQKTNS